MAKIKNIGVKITYSVGLGGVTAPKKVIGQLEEIAAAGEELDDSQADLKYPEAAEWIREKIRHRDCYESRFEIIELTLNP
jgi:hypothetical protein